MISGMQRSAENALPEPPWWDVPKRGEPRATLSREAIVDAAIDVLDSNGLDGLSMRRVAEALGTGPASLYWHVADKEQLIHLILDRVMGEFELPEPDPTRWEEQIRAFAHEARATFSKHRDVGLASLGRVPMGPNLIRIAEWLLGLLRGAGIPNRPATWFVDLIALVGAAQSVEDDMASIGEDPVINAMGDYLAALPPDRFPNLAAVASDMVVGSPDERFEFGLDLLLRGLKSFIDTGTPEFGQSV
jgi:AcrR family transcriptional regulator